MMKLMNSIIFLCGLFAISFSVGVNGQDDGLLLRGELTQGSLLRGHLPQGSTLVLNGHTVDIAPNGDFAFGFRRDAELVNTLTWTLPDGQQHKRELTLVPREYNIQRIEGLAPAMVTPPQAVLERIRKDGVNVANARAKRYVRTDFMEDFIWPAEGPITGVYGSQRVLNGQPKRPHYGVDVGAPIGTPVVAPASGIVTLADGDLYYSGGTIIIDHGMGVNSTFLHLSEVNVQPGDEVKQGQLIGAIGDTGRATGPHLDWRINWQKERLDPALLVPKR
jgi:murein DD-endopeptidase MepM/ murein hydrolase activator NlpD